MITDQLDKTKPELIILEKEVESELGQLLVWWKEHMVDQEKGGFYGRISGHNMLYKEAEKGVILNTRLLWTFAAAALHTGSATYEKMADRSFQYLQQYFVDQEFGGLYWMLNAEGQIVQPKKQIYAQAFGIYGLSEYYKLRKQEDALHLALELFDLIEAHSCDAPGSYLEAFQRNWQPIADFRLSDKDANEAKTMNTHLHIMEAYTNLYQVYPHEKVRKALQCLINCFLDKFISLETGHLHLFFDEEWKLMSDIISYGHDIECSWLLLEAAEVLGEAALIARVQPIIMQMAEVTLKEGFDQDGGIMYEKAGQHVDKEKHWWVQAEAVVGFLNAYQISQNQVYLQATIRCWDFIKNTIKDEVYGEWVWSILEDGTINRRADKAGPWKAPYHNGRMCLEVERRVRLLQGQA